MQRMEEIELQVAAVNASDEAVLREFAQQPPAAAKSWIQRHRMAALLLLLVGIAVLGAVIYLILAATHVVPGFGSKGSGSNVDADQVDGSWPVTDGSDKNDAMEASAGNETPLEVPELGVPEEDFVQPEALALAAEGVALNLQFGIAGGGALQSRTQADLNKYMDTMVALGTTWLRIDINWHQIEASSTSGYDFSLQDKVVNTARSRGIRILAIVQYAPAWLTGAATTPSSPARYATFCADVVRRYAPMGVAHYEIWNEANWKLFFTPQPNVVTYAALLKAAYPAMKAVNASITIITAGSAPAVTDGSTAINQLDFLEGLYANGAGGSFDAVASHPYCYDANTMPGDPAGWSAWAQISQTTRSLRSIMLANGDGHKQIWGTEWGAPTNGVAGQQEFVTEAVQATMMDRAIRVWATYSWGGPLFIYGLVDEGVAPDDREAFFGIVRKDYSLKPGFTAAQQAIKDLSPPSCSICQPPVGSVPLALQFGAAAASGVGDEADATVGTFMERTATLGARWVRFEIDWSLIEPVQGSFNWARQDKIVAQARAQGLSMLGVITRSPAWVATSSSTPPSPTQWAAFTAAVVRRYSPLGVSAFEMWDQVNLFSFFSSTTLVPTYAALLQAAYPAMKAANASITILTGGFAPAPNDGGNLNGATFLQQLYDAGAGNYFDAVAAQPFCYDANTMPGANEGWSAWAQMSQTTSSLRSVMTANGDSGKRIWGTEWGAPTNGASGQVFVTEAMQATMYDTAVRVWASYSWAGPLFFYSLWDKSADSSDRENMFGIFRRDWSAKPAVASTQTAIAAVTASYTNTVSYAWSATAYSSCSCSSLQTRQVTCRGSDGSTGDDSLCAASVTKPPTSLACTAPVSCFAWRRSAFTACSNNCDGGIRTATLTCVQSALGPSPGAVVSATRCSTIAKPATSQACGTATCPRQWRSTAWSACTRRCGGGIQTRTVTCYRYQNGVWEEALGCAAAGLTKPATQRACNTQRC